MRNVTFAIGAICIKQVDATDAMMSLFVRILAQITRDCPLVEVPTPHGRLFDADELKKALDERFDEMRNMYPSIRFGPGWMLASSVIVHSPIVIEAEREEHDE